jgi:hypothetical protein
MHYVNEPGSIGLIVAFGYNLNSIDKVSRMRR